MRPFSASTRAMIVGDGGAPPVATVHGRSRGAASGCASIEMSTVGAAQRCVMPSSRRWRHTASGSGRGRHTWRPPAAVTAHV